ncbi:uncharacterized protein TNCV_112681 [Trichonephila clavipes]|nr:uncharacterized protein TNCV_112681 [Trichonephila clavipes]
MTPELAPPPLTTTPQQREDVSALSRFNVHRYPTRQVFSGTGLELVTRKATILYLYLSQLPRPPVNFSEQCVMTGPLKMARCATGRVSLL